MSAASCDVLPESWHYLSGPCGNEGPMRNELSRYVCTCALGAGKNRRLFALEEERPPWPVRSTAGKPPTRLDEEE